jgi:hypothetical protein
MRKVLASAAKAELAALFHNGRKACTLRFTLKLLGHKQPPTPIVTDNTSTAFVIAKNTVKQKRSKAIDMRCYWICNLTCQGQFVVYWHKSVLNKANYFTKPYSSDTHYQQVRSSYLLSKENLTIKNYFKCLEDIEAASFPEASEPPLAKSAPNSGEGVLNSRIPNTTKPVFPYLITLLSSPLTIVFFDTENR